MSFSHDKVIDSIFVSFHWILLLEEANSTFAAYTNEHLHVLPSCLIDIMTIHINISSILPDIHITWRTFQCYVLLKMVRKNPYIWNFFYIWNFSSGNYKFNTRKIYILICWHIQRLCRLREARNTLEWSNNTLWTRALTEITEGVVRVQTQDLKYPISESSSITDIQMSYVYVISIQMDPNTVYINVRINVEKFKIMISECQYSYL